MGLLPAAPGRATAFLCGLAQGALLPKGFQTTRKQKVLPRLQQKTDLMTKDVDCLFYHYYLQLIMIS